MCFERLLEAQNRGELLMVSGGMCHWHLRRDGQLTIREIFSNRRGAGREMIERLKNTENAEFILAKCPVDLPSNGWYKKLGFELDGTETTSSGRGLNRWRLQLG